VWIERTDQAGSDHPAVGAGPSLGTMELADGELVMFSGQPRDGDAPGGTAPLTSPEEDWVRRPAPSCPAAMWHVAEVRVPSTEGIHATPGANAKGWSIEEAKLQQKANRSLDRITGPIYRQRRDIWIGAALSEDPGGAPSLYVKGPAPQFVRDLVAGAGYLIIIVDEQPYSSDELEVRSSRVLQALVDAGYPSVSGGADYTRDGIIEAWVLQVGDLPADEAAILALVPEDLRADVDLHVTIAPPRPTAEPGAWGPLAVLYRPQGFGPGVGLAPVTLHIDEACVWIEGARSRYATTLVWEGNHVDWRPKNRSILFIDRKGNTFRLADGDRIEGGGTGLWSSEGPEGQDLATPWPEPGERWPASLDEAWLQQPDPSCPKALFFLTDVTRLGRGSASSR
jgi:hypothetical protein